MNVFENIKNKLINVGDISQQSHSIEKIHWSITASVIYLVAPLFLFAFSFFRVELAVVACLYIVFVLAKLIINTGKCEIENSTRSNITILLIVIIWLFFAGNIGPLLQNGDWFKHYAVLRLLSEESWPVNYILEGHIEEMYLKYSLGWYLIPAFVLKFIGTEWMQEVSGVWTGLGLFLFFRVLHEHYKSKRAIVLVMLIFVFFSGADFIGTLLTELQLGSINHIEWWAGWIQYPSSMTSLFWTPQHAVSAWLGSAILFFQIKKENSTFLSIGPQFLTFVAIFFWSPFAAIGVLPLYVVLLFKFGYRAILTNIHGYISFILLFVPLAMYMLSGSADIPGGFIWLENNRCVVGEVNDTNCFTFFGYFRFIFLEFGLILLVILWTRKIRKNDALLYLAGGFLLLLPFVRYGVYNDLAMRASIPAIAVICLYLSDTILNYRAKTRYLLLLLLLLGIPTAIGEATRSFFTRPEISNNERRELYKNNTVDVLLTGKPNLVSQYFTKNRSNVLRKGDSQYVANQEYLFNIDDLAITSTFGSADFDIKELKIHSDTYADAAFVTESVVLPKGYYRVEVGVNESHLESNRAVNAGHVSLHTKYMIVPIVPSLREGEEILTGSFYSDGKPFRFSFGLGGWSSGRGTIKFNDIRLMSVKKIKVTE